MSPQNDVSVLSSGSGDASLFGKTVVTDIIKLRFFR